MVEKNYISESVQRIKTIDVDALHKAFEDVKTAMDRVHEKMAETFVTMFINDWEMALDNMSSAEKLYAGNRDESELIICCLDEIEELEATWKESFTSNEESDDADSTIACINRQIREYIYELSGECGYSGNYIETALECIAKKGEISKIRVFVDGLEMGKDG